MFYKHQPSGAEATRSQSATPHRLQRRTTCNAAPPATPHRLQRLQRRTACNAALPATPNHPLNPKWLTGSGKRLSLIRLFDPPINFHKTSFLIRATFRLPSPYGGRQTSLGPPKSKNGDHFSIVIWALRTTFAK